MNEVLKNGCIIRKFAEKEYIPHQPYLEFNTNYYSMKLNYNDALSGIVWEVYQVDNFDISKTLSLPDACADVMVFYTDNNVYAYFMSALLEVTSMIDLKFMPNVKTIFGVKFCTGILGNLFKCKIKDVGIGIIDIQDAFFDGIEILKDLSEAKDFWSRWDIFKDYLLGRLEKDYKVNPISNYISKSVIDKHGKIIIRDLENEIGYSGRYLRKVITENIGISIKQLCEITQFQWAYHIYIKSKGQVSLAELAFQGGYYDQSHMNNSFKKLTGQLPRKIINMYM